MQQYGVDIVTWGSDAKWSFFFPSEYWKSGPKAPDFTVMWGLANNSLPKQNPAEKVGTINFTHPATQPQGCVTQVILLSLLDLGDESLQWSFWCFPRDQPAWWSKVHSNPCSLHSGFLENPKYRNKLGCNRYNRKSPNLSHVHKWTLGDAHYHSMLKRKN